MAASSVAIGIGDIVTSLSPCDPGGAHDILALIMNKKPFVASSLSVYNPIDRTHSTLASIGYDTRVLEHLNGGLINDDVIYQHYRNQGPRQRAWKWDQMPINYLNTYSVQEVYLPAGFRDGITLCLYTRDGRYTGNLHISSDDARFPTQGMIDDVQCSRKMLGNFSDVLRSISDHRIMQFEGMCGFLLTSKGNFVKIPGKDLPSSSFSNALISRVGRCDSEEIPECFLFKHGTAWFRVIFEVLRGGTRAIIADECDVPYNLTARELEIMTLMISGATNKEIASKIFVAPATVSKHVENIFAKLNCNSRASVVATALVSDLRCLLP